MKNSHGWVRGGLAALSLVFLLSCGGGGGTSGGSVSGSLAGNGMTVHGASSGDNGDGAGNGGSSSGNASSGGDGSTSTAANGNGDSGVGSGGTGVSADASTSVGSVDGMGSIFVGDLRYNTDQTQLDLRDGAALQIGMTVQVTGPVDAAFANGTALKVMSMAQLRGPVSGIDLAGSSFQLQGSTVGVDPTTVWADSSGLASLTLGTQVQVWALPVGPGVLRATRIETQAVGAAPLVTGMVAQLDTASRTFRLGGLVIDYRAATLPAGGLSNGRIVRVAGVAASGTLMASQIDGWYALSSVKGASVQLEGVISDFRQDTQAFSLMGTPVDASIAQVTGGQANKLGNGVTVVASGTLSDAGVLVASKLKIRHIPGGGPLSSFSLIGPISNYTSLSGMTVRGQKVDASTATVAGTGQFANGVKVSVQGSELVNNVLRATQISFVP